MPSSRFSRLAWGYAATALNVGVGVVMLPVIVRCLPAAEVGLWLVFLTLGALAQLFEIGFPSTVARNVAYVFAGDQRLCADGIVREAKGALNRQLLADLHAAARWLYGRVALAAGVLLAVAGTAYVASVTPPGVDGAQVLRAWLLYAAAATLNFHFGYLTAFLQGRGDVTQANQVVVLSRALQIVLGTALVLLGHGLVGLGLAALAAAAASRMLAWGFLRRYPPTRGAAPTALADRRYLVGVLWHNGSRYGLVLVGLFLIMRATTLVATSALGVTEAAGYALAVQLFVVLQSLALVPWNLASPELNRLHALHLQARLQERFARVLVATLAVATAGASLLVALGPWALALVGSATHLPGRPVLALMAVAFVLELNHGACANLLATGNRIPFVRAYLATGVAIVVASWWIAPLAGVAGLVTVNVVLQLAYNNWRWPLAVARLFDVRYARVLADGLAGPRVEALPR